MSPLWTFILFTESLVITYNYWILKLLWEKFLSIDTVMVRDPSSRVGPANKNAMSNLCPEKSQPTWSSCRKNELDAIIGRMKVQITKRLCPVIYMACTYAWLKTETVFWSIIFTFHLWLHYLLYSFLKMDHEFV